MKASLPVLVAILLSTGCRHKRPYCEQEVPFPAIHLQQLPFSFQPVLPVQPIGQPCPQQYVTQATVGTTATGTIPVSAIKLHKIEGVNAVLLLGAMRQAAANAKYPLDKSIAQTVRDNEVAVTTEPIADQEYFLRHYVSAEIHGTDIELRVRSVILDQNKIALPNRPHQNIPERVHADIKAALVSAGGV